MGGRKGKRRKQLGVVAVLCAGLLFTSSSTSTGPVHHLLVHALSPAQRVGGIVNMNFLEPAFEQLV